MWYPFINGAIADDANVIAEDLGGITVLFQNNSSTETTAITADSLSLRMAEMCVLEEKTDCNYLT